MFWICAGNSIDNTGRFQLLLSSACTEPRPFLFPTPPHQRVGWGWTQPGQLTPADQRDARCHMTSCSAYKTGGRTRKRGCSELWCLSSQVTVTCDGALLSCLVTGWVKPQQFLKHHERFHLLLYK